MAQNTIQNGILIYEQFKQGIGLFFKVTQQCSQQQWEYKVIQSGIGEQAYLIQQCSKALANHSEVQRSTFQHTEGQGTSCTSEQSISQQDNDDSVAVQSNSMILNWTYGLTYHDSYRVPVLRFNVKYQDGGQLDMSTVESILKPVYTNDQILAVEENSYEHDLFYFQHPCNTSDIMKELMSGIGNDPEGRQILINKVRSEISFQSMDHTDESILAFIYIVRWLSVYGYVVGIKLPLSIINLATS